MKRVNEILTACCILDLHVFSFLSDGGGGVPIAELEVAGLQEAVGVKHGVQGATLRRRSQLFSGHSDSVRYLDVVGLVDVQNGLNSLREIGLAYNASRSTPTV